MAKILFFGPLSDLLDIEALEVKLPAQVRTVSDLIAHLHERGPAWQRYLQADKLQITRNRQIGDANMAIVDSDEIAFISRPGAI
jgi:sulfur-carrier protein